jgi:hypothetical protein
LRRLKFIRFKNINRQNEGEKEKDSVGFMVRERGVEPL